MKFKLILYSIHAKILMIMNIDKQIVFFLFETIRY